MLDSQGLRLLVIFAPALSLAAVIFAAFAGFLIRRPARRGPRRRQGSALMPVVFIDFAYWGLEPLLGGLRRLGVRPDHVTAFSLYLAVLAAAALATGYFGVGAWLLVAAAGCDLLDGALARSTNAASPAGAFLDSVIDRLTESVVFFGIAIYGGGGALSWAAIAALIASFLVSYARARGESLGVAGDSGLMQRPERLFLLIVVVFAAPITAVFIEPEAAHPAYHVAIVGIGLHALLSAHTVLARARSIYNRLGEAPEPSAEDPTSERPDGLDHQASTKAV